MITESEAHRADSNLAAMMSTYLVRPRQEVMLTWHRAINRASFRNRFKWCVGVK